MGRPPYSFQELSHRVFRFELGPSPSVRVNSVPSGSFLHGQIIHARTAPSYSFLALTTSARELSESMRCKSFQVIIFFSCVPDAVLASSSLIFNACWVSRVSKSLTSFYVLHATPHSATASSRASITGIAELPALSIQRSSHAPSDLPRYF